MATLAPELLHLIVSQVALSYVQYPEQGLLRKDLGTLRSLRLANRNLCRVASEYLFEELTLYFTEASHAKMMAIAKHPNYSACVRSMGISPKAIFGSFLDRDAFGQWFHQARSLVRCDAYSEGYFYIPERMAYLQMKDGSVVDLHHAEYTSLYKKQEQLFVKAGDFLKTAIGCFSRLELVESSVRTPPTAYSVPSTDDACISDLWQDSACLYKYDLDHSAMILTAVSQGRSLAATQFDFSELFCKMDTMVMDLPDSGQIQRLVPDSKKLNLCIQTSDLAGLRQLLNTGKCERFLSAMKNLESLACSIDELEFTLFPHPSISNLFGGNTWQHLRRLELIRFYTSASTLAELLSRHKSTLQELSLQHILLWKGSWREVFVDLRQAALRTVEVYHLGCGTSPDIFFDDIEDTHLDPISSSHPLHTFLFQGASWRPYMEVVLEGSKDVADDSTTEGMDSDEDSE